MKKILVSCLASALLAVSAGASAEPQQPDASNFNLTFAVELDREGRITGLEPQPAMDSPELMARIESEVRGWEFSPAKLDGQPVPTRTYLRLGVRAPGLQAEKARIVSATTGPAIASMTAPGYPPAALRRGEGGLVLLKLKLDTQGRVRGVAAQPGSSPNRAFTEAASAAAKNWRFLPELANGQPVKGLETIDEQVRIMAGFSEPAQLAFLHATLKSFAEAPTELDRMVGANRHAFANPG